MKSKTLGVLVLSVVCCALSAVTLIESNFNAPEFSGAGAQKKQVATAKGIWDGFNGREFSIVPDPKDPKTKVLQVERIGSGTLTVAVPEIKVPDNPRQFRFKALPGAEGTSGFHVSFANREAGKNVANLRFDGNGKTVYVTTTGHQHSCLEYVPEVWQEFVVDFDPQSDNFLVTRITADGKSVVSKPMPYAEKLPVNSIRIGNYPTGRPERNVAYLKDISYTVSDTASLTGRANVAGVSYEAKAYLRQPGAPDSEKGKLINKLNDGDLSSDSAVSFNGLPQELVIELPDAQLVSTVRVYSGDLQYSLNASGDLSLKEYKVELMSTQSGFWYEVGHRKNLPTGKSLGLTLEEQGGKFFDVFDFPPMEATALKLTVLGSNDTLKRHDVHAKPQVETIIREVELYSFEVQSERKSISSILEAEFRLPVYRYQDKAELYMILDKAEPEMRVQISFKERFNGLVPCEPMIVTLKPGENIIPVDIKDWANGHYRAGIRAYGKDAQVGGEFGRLLRLERLSEPVKPEKVTDMTGKTLYFPDEWYVEENNGVAFDIALPQTHRGSYTQLKPNHTNVQCDAVGFDKDGRVYLSYRSVDRTWDFSTQTRFNSKFAPDMQSFEYREGNYPGVDWTRADITKFHCKKEELTPAMADKSKFRFYDPEKDGPIDLKNLKVIHVGYQARDWGIVKPKQQSTWVVYEKDGEFLLPLKERFLQDSYSGNEFEDPWNSNDNMSGQYLSDDGKTLIYVRGLLLKRYAPFVHKYDNLWRVARIMTVFYTQDGINWKRQYFGLPDENDPPNAQHYGAGIYKTPGGNGLMISYTSPYNAREQQFYVELYYSWDGYTWKRYPGHQAWIPNDGPGGWRFGCINLHNNIGEKGNYYYHTIGWANSEPHFAGDYTAYNDRMKVLDGEYIRSRYQARGMEDWPYFKDFGSYEALADAVKSKDSGASCGVFIYRKNGWFKISAKDKAADLTTIPVGAASDMKANVLIKDGGYIRFTLLDTDGNAIAGFDKTLSNVDDAQAQVFETLPKGLFKIKIELKNAELYGVMF